MLEIFFLIFLTRKIGEKVEAKGRASIGYKILVVLAWFFGELTGMFIGGVVDVVVHGAPEGYEPSLLVMYPCALVGAATGAGASFLLVALLSTRQLGG